jgi:hypothetical protein
VCLFELANLIFSLFVESKEKIAQLNIQYGAEFQKLYNEAQTVSENFALF